MNLLQEIEAADPSAHRDIVSAIERLILKYAMRSFGRRGYAATSLRNIAAEARVTAPMVSYYFESKEGLFLRVAEIVMASVERNVERALQQPQPFHRAIESIVSAHVRLTHESPAAVEFMLSMLYGPREGQPEPDLDRMYRTTRRHIVATFERGIATGEFLPRAGVGVNFLVEQLVSLIHEHAIRNFRAERACRANPVSVEMALEHFFFGAGRLVKEST